MSQELFIKNVIKSRLRVEDPEIYEKLVDIIYKFSLILLYGDNALRRQAVDALFSALPEDIVIGLMQEYATRILARYQKLMQIAAAFAPRTRGGNIEDMFIQMALDMFKSQFTQNPQAQQQQQQQTPIPAQVPEELKKLLE